MYSSEFSFPVSSTPSSEFDWPSHSHTSHSSPTSEFAMLEEMTSLALYPTPPAHWDPSLASMLSALEAAPPDFLRNPPQNPLDDYSALLDSSLPLPDPGLSAGSSSSLPAVKQSHPDTLPLMTSDEMDSAGEEWPWEPSGTVWLDNDVSSDVYVPAEPFRVTQNCRVERIERVSGVPSQMPVPRVPTAYIINFSSVRDTYKDEDGETMNLELILKDKDCHSWDGTPGERQTGRAPSVNVKLFTGVGVFEKVLCRNRSQAWPTHTGTYISADVDENLCVRFFRGESVDTASADKGEGTSTCSRIIGSGSGKKGKQLCPFPHLKDGVVHTAQMIKRTCKAATTIYVPLDKDTIPIAIVVPKHAVPHTHPPPPPTKVPTDVRTLYEEAVRAVGVSIATVNKVERAATTIQIMGKAPGLVHPSLLQVSTKQGIITALKRRDPGGDKSGWEGLFELYKIDQEKDPQDRYIYSFDFLPGRSPASVVITTFETILLECVELVRSIDQDTTFKRLKAGLLNEYELTAFFTPLDRLFTFGRLYMDAKDADAFEFAWDKIHEAFFAATNKVLAFKAWSKDGWLVTMGGDMESAPWIGMARSFIKRMDPDNRPTVDEFLAKVCRVCRRHALEGLRKGIQPHVDDDQWPRFQGFLDLTTREDVQIFSDWVFSLDIPKVTAWWNHKLNHKWILPGLLECLSGLSHDDWLTTPFTSNGNETQHHWTNSQTGIGLNAKECIVRAAAADHAVGQEFEASLASGVLANFRNELSHRTDRNVKRHTSAVEKTKRARAGNNKIQELRSQLAILVAEQKTSSSGVVRVRQKSKSSGLSATLKGKGPVRESAKSKGKQRQRTEEELDPDDDDIDTNVFKDPTLRIKSNPPQFSEPQDLNSGVTVESGTMEFDGDPAPVGLVQIGTSLNATPPSSHALASVRVLLSPRRSTRKRAASTVHSDAPPSKIISAESSGIPVITADSGRRTRRKPKPWGVVHDNQTYTSFEFLAQFPDEYRSLYGDAEPA
ncbi:hypothetical protein MVEN_01833400 [Mycena venus]|uniref:Uncharacterized protein n=1 Tax=Mycena venus TaxID=2733690 RepID=A0A8H6XL41_9AGAR|nr:hypothetical protein MVEN_01833400 [Mycena venus]